MSFSRKIKRNQMKVKDDQYLLKEKLQELNKLAKKSFEEKRIFIWNKAEEDKYDKK